MGKVKEFIEKYSRYIELFLSSTVLVLFLLIVIDLIGIFDITIFITFKNLLFIFFSLISLYILLRFERSKKREVFKKVLRGLFLGVLLLQVLSVNGVSLSFFLFRDYSITFNNYSQYINFFFVIISLLLLFTHREEINKKEEKDISNRWAYVILVGILVLFTWIKAPYFDYNFTGEHSMKYNTYVEPAKYMAERNDFTWYQQKYLGNPVDNPQGIRSSLPQLPLLEWMLASTFKLMPHNSIEFNTRLVTHAIGIMTLIFSYLFIKKWSNNRYALITTILMTTNSIVSFATFVTVLDGLNFMLLLISLFSLTKYLEDDMKYLSLFTSGIFVGLGLSIKISFLIWALPSTLLLIFYKNKNLSKRVLNFFTLYLYAGLVYLTTKFSIPLLRENRDRSILLLLSGILLLGALFFIIKKYYKRILKTFSILHKKKLLIPGLIILALVLVPISKLLLLDDNLLKNFLTDKELLFNFSLYKYMLFNQFVNYVTLPLFLMSVVGFILLLFVKESKIKQINFVLLLSSIFFWVIASKSIFPHSYYTEIIMFGVLLGSTTLIYFVFRIFKKSFLTFLLLFLLVILIRPLVINNTLGYLQIQIPYFDEAAQYLEDNSKENELYIDESYFLSLTLETGRARVGDLNYLSDEQFKENVKSIGFKDTMEKYNVKYLITSNNTPNYSSYAHIFTDEYLQTSEFDRGQIIQFVLDPIKYSRFSDEEHRKEIVQRYDIENKFVFEKQIGVYRFFRFSN